MAWKPRLLALLGLFAPMLMEGYQAWTDTHEIPRVLDRIQRIYTGYDLRSQEWNGNHMMKGLLPLGIGIFGSWLASKLKINRYFPKWINL